MTPESPIEKIELFTTKAGLQLYNTASENLLHYAEHIDKISIWYSQLENILKLFPTAFKKEDYDSLRIQLSFNGLLSISILDLSIIVRQAYVSHIKSEQLFYIKQGYLLIHSTIKHYENKLNKYFTDLVKNSHNELSLEFKSISLSLRKFKVNHKLYTEIKDIRDNIAGHIEEDFIKYYNTVTSLDAEKAFKTISDFVSIMTSMQIFSAKLIKIYQLKFE
jgi:hypothetical protein